MEATIVPSGVAEVARLQAKEGFCVHPSLIFGFAVFVFPLCKNKEIE